MVSVISTVASALPAAVLLTVQSVRVGRIGKAPPPITAVPPIQVAAILAQHGIVAHRAPDEQQGQRRLRAKDGDRVGQRLGHRNAVLQLLGDFQPVTGKVQHGDRHAVLGQRARLVGADDGDRAQGLDARHAAQDAQHELLFLVAVGHRQRFEQGAVDVGVARRADFVHEGQRLRRVPVGGCIRGGLREQLDRRCGGLELVGRVGHEVPSHGIQPREICDVLDNHQGAPGRLPGAA